MIQRIQTVFLLLAALISVLLFFLPSQQYIAGRPVAGANILFYTALPFNLPPDTSPVIYGLFAANLAILIFSLLAVFQYKNRKKQLKTSRLPLVFAAVFMALTLLFKLNTSPAYSKVCTWASYLPVGTMLFALLAGIFIKKDEDLVRSADRIR